MPRSKNPADGSTSPKTKKKRQPGSIHPSLKHLESACVSVDSDGQGSGESELEGLTGTRFMLHRVGPKSACQGRRLYLHTFHYSPSLEEIKELFGGGEFWIQIYENGSYSKGSPRIIIEGDPKIVTEDSPEKALGTLPVSPDPIVNALMQTLMQFMDRMVEEIRELKGVAPVSTGLSPEKIRELMNAATEAQLTNRLILMATGGSEGSSAVEAESVTERRLKSLLDMFKMGIETGREGVGGDGMGGLIGKFAPLLEKMMVSPAVNAVRPTAVPTQAAPVAPIVDVSQTAVSQPTEKDREDLERKAQEFKTEMLIQKLQSGVGSMLDALESEVEYDDKQVCDFIIAAVPVEELALVREYLTFDKVRLLSQSNPQDQIYLDMNRVRVKGVLVELMKRLS